MKRIKFMLCSCLLLAVGMVRAQSPKAIKADFNKAFENLNYWSEHSSEDTTGDKLVDANTQIEKKLKYYTQKYPGAITQAFKEIGGIISDDGRFRILSWDTNTGGTLHVFENVIQYKSGNEIISIMDTTNAEGDYVFAYNEIYTLKVGSETYYLTTYHAVLDLYYRGEGIRVFAIKNGKLNTKVRLIKTKSGLTNELYYLYNETFGSADDASMLTIGYNPEAKTITFPVVIRDKKTDKTITYKFNGQYFEKVILAK